MISQAHWKVLRGRYHLIRPLHNADSSSESWLALDEMDNQYLVKLWPFHSEVANDLRLQRALWDTELRTMYRVSSSPGAEETLLVIREAGLDHDNKCFVMTMEAKGASSYDSLLDLLPQRNNYPWLSNANVDARRQLWIGLRQIGQGLQLLHSQTVLHRNVGVENVFLYPDIGPTSFRLGGFEWSVRLGELHLLQPPTGWACPPEFSESGFFGYRPETDWYGFGMLAARCLLNLEAHAKLGPRARHERVLKEIHGATGRYLSEREREILERLVARDRADRLTRGYEILTVLDDLIESLRSVQLDRTDTSLIVAYNPETNHALVETAIENGFVPNPGDPQEVFNPRALSHCTRLSTFLQEDLTEAQIYLSGTDYILLGKRLGMRIVKLREFDHQSGRESETWDVAMCIDTADLRRNDGGNTWTELPRNMVVVRKKDEVRRDQPQRARAQNWEKFLPRADTAAKLRTSLTRFLDFIRCTNQIELLMRDAELFEYEVVDRQPDGDSERVEIKEVSRSRPVLDFLKPEGGLVQFLLREIESNKEYCRYVLLRPEDTLRFDRGQRIAPKDCFIVRDIKPEGTVTLYRSGGGEPAIAAPDHGWLRTFGMFGQMDLIRRRKEAIDRLVTHSYLLRSLYAPGQVFMDTGDVHLPVGLDGEKVDAAKQAVMKDVLRTRPIYALQGPPGTGKTTMVAHLLRQIFGDDSVAQVLITAQAHGAVDVLRAKVHDEAFADVEEASKPLAVRLGRENPETGNLEGSVESVAEEILSHSVDRLKQLDHLNPIQQEWCECAKRMIAPIHTNQPDRDASEFKELLRRGASITYCTTSAGDLEELARSVQSYDWSIIEEAGKCHGFDLALPLQAGHRWLLIGDQKQLEPYRYGDYMSALQNLETVVDSLRSLPARAGNLIDVEWMARWENMTEIEHKEFKTFALARVRTFVNIFDNCAAAYAGSQDLRKTIGESIGAAAGMLSLQYRMHPTIGTLISEAYYEGMLKNQTVGPDGQPQDMVTLPLSAPEEIRGAAIVWIDTPPASLTAVAQEKGPAEHQPRYTNPFELSAIKGFLSCLRLDPSYLTRVSLGTAPYLKLAVLSPYNQQVSLLRRSLPIEMLPEGLMPKEGLSTRHSLSSPGSKPRLLHSVDSFQGNEADVIIVSLVRNNTGHIEYGKPLGFLLNPQRMNVLLSRAQRLLVLVGSFEFFREQVLPYSEEDTAREEWHLKKVVSLLEEWFANGRAVRLDAAAFVEKTR